MNAQSNHPSNDTTDPQFLGPEAGQQAGGGQAHELGDMRTILQAALTQPGESFVAVLKKKVPLVLTQGDTSYPLELSWTALPEGGAKALCSLPTDLAPAALFGSARGAFTGADKAAPGYFDQAQGGSLFLDEIGDTSADVQPLLLRALQQREIQAVGGPIRRVDVRVISATDAALEGVGCDFKAALRHRLGAIEILLPPLREHPEDVGELLLHFLPFGLFLMEMILQYELQ